MRTIYKAPLTDDFSQRVMMPRGAQILSAHVQDGHPFIWFLGDTAEKDEPREIIVCLTGDRAPECRTRFIGTVLLKGGSYVLHVFERLPVSA